MNNNKKYSIKRVKRQGYMTELEFQRKAFEKGLIVSKPFGENWRYDFIIDTENDLYRVQVKSCTNKRNNRNGYRADICYGKKSGKNRKAYDNKSIDFLAIYIIPEEIWYIIPVEITRGVKRICLYPNTEIDTKYGLYKENWKFVK